MTVIVPIWLCWTLAWLTVGLSLAAILAWWSETPWDVWSVWAVLFTVPLWPVTLVAAARSWRVIVATARNRRESSKIRKQLKERSVKHNEQS